MATFRIYEDQENRLHNPIGRSKDKIASLAQNKRTVLGVLQSNRVNEFSKDEKQQIKNKTASSNQTEQQYSLFEEPSFKVYEDKLIKETSVALRESQKENSTVTSSTYIYKESETILSSRPALQEITAKVNEQVEQSVKEKSEIKLDDESSNSFVFDRSFFTDIKSRREVTKARSNLFDCDIYRADIYNYLRVAETEHRPKPGYINKQPDITNAMRAILIDWLVEVSEEYKLHAETLYLAVSYIDRFLSYMSVVRAKLQLVGTAAMFIAAKYEEIYPPDIGEFVYITDDTYTKKQVLKMEHLILRVLSFDLTVPTPITFLMHYCTHNNLSDKIKYLAMYLCELAMLEGDPYLKYVPSLLSASAIVLAQHTLREEIWPHELELSSGYNLQDLKDCVLHLTKTFRMAGTLQQQSIQEKYKLSKYGQVANLLPRSSEIYDDDSEA